MNKKDDSPLTTSELISYIHREKWYWLNDYYSAIVSDFTKILAILTGFLIGVALLKDELYFSIESVFEEPWDFWIKVVVGVILTVIVISWIYSIYRERKIQRNVYAEVYYRGVEEIIQAVLDKKFTEPSEVIEKHNELLDMCHFWVSGEERCKGNIQREWEDRMYKLVSRVGITTKVKNLEERERRLKEFFKGLISINILSLVFQLC